MKRMLFFVCMFLMMGTTYSMAEKNTFAEMASDGYVVGVQQLPAAAQEVCRQRGTDHIEGRRGV